MPSRTPHPATFHATLHRALTASGMSLQGLHTALSERGHRVSVATLSYWQRGERHPSRRESLLAVTAIEELLGLTPRTLSSLVAPPRSRGGSTGQGRRFEELLNDESGVDRMVANLDHTSDLADTVTLMERWTIGPDRGMRTRRNLHVVRARHDVDRHLLIYSGEPGGHIQDVRLNAVRGCRMGRTLRDTEHTVVVAELLFDRMLRAGQTHVMEYEVLDPDPVQDTYYRFTRRAIRSYVLQIRFTPPALPVRCYRYEHESLDAPRVAQRELHLDSQHAVHIVENDIRPGLVGVAWEWD